MEYGQIACHYGIIDITLKISNHIFRFPDPGKVMLIL